MFVPTTVPDGPAIVTAAGISSFAGWAALGAVAVALAASPAGDCSWSTCVSAADTVTGPAPVVSSTRLTPLSLVPLTAPTVQRPVAASYEPPLRASARMRRV